jgi:hypothetical protein
VKGHRCCAELPKRTTTQAWSSICFLFYTCRATCIAVSLGSTKQSLMCVVPVWIFFNASLWYTLRSLHNSAKVMRSMKLSADLHSSAWVLELAHARDERIKSLSGLSGSSAYHVQNERPHASFSKRFEKTRLDIGIRTASANSRRCACQFCTHESGIEYCSDVLITVLRSRRVLEGGSDEDITAAQ